LNANSRVTAIGEQKAIHQLAQSYAGAGADWVNKPDTDLGIGMVARPALTLCEKRPSRWTSSRAKRFFDCACVLFALPLLLPVLLVIALAVRLTSRGPVLFQQMRVGLHGRTFTILKFRSMTHDTDEEHHAVTTAGNRQFTSIGPFLRRWKLDELPQLLNVLRGDMSLVGPRPKIPEHMIADLPCRPGITGAATIAFALEEVLLDRVPRQRLYACFYTVILPAKRKLDVDYMAQATFLSDLRVLFKSALRRWDHSVIEYLLSTEAIAGDDQKQRSGEAGSKASLVSMTRSPSENTFDALEQATGL
jgi:lipopolysaccharide/colanic/teichoic acid biosynthesis glycosyltransferase